MNEWELPKRYSRWTRLVRITTYVLRFIKNSQGEKDSQPRKRLPIEISELREATHRWFRLVQKVHFSKEWSALSKNEPIPNSSAKALKPMLGEDSLLHFGGRLLNAALEYGEKHPIILPKHRKSELLIDCAHRAILHGGNALHSFEKRTFWTNRNQRWVASRNSETSIGNLFLGCESFSPCEFLINLRT